MLSGSRLIKRGLHPTQEKQSAQAVLRFIRSIPGGSLFGPDITIRKVVRPMLWDVTRPTLYASTEPRITRPCRGLHGCAEISLCTLKDCVHHHCNKAKPHRERKLGLWPSFPSGVVVKPLKSAPPSSPLRRSLIIDILVKLVALENSLTGGLQGWAC